MIATLLFLVLVVWIAVVLLVREPSNDRDWIDSQAVLPYAEFSGDTVTIYNIRNTVYRARYDYTTEYYNKTFDLNELETVDYIVEPFASVAAAHTLLSFGFSDGSQVAISGEARREKGEIFNPLFSATKNYEFMYTIADERDVLALRAIHRDNQVFIYPTQTSAENVKKLFVEMLTRANQLRDTPEFYSLLTNSCSTNIARHINNISPGRIGWDYRILLPKESDALAYELGLLDTEKTLEELRTMYDATASIKEMINEDDFSIAIRAHQITTDSIQ